jgi:exodeoxyribonuclease V gamma subunit
MSGLHLYTNNRLERLADKLAMVLAADPPSPIEPETIIVQSRGMQRFVSLALARRHGICANTRFPFPNAFIDRLFRQFFPQLPKRSSYEVPVLTWSIMKVLPDAVRQPGFERLRAYLSGTGDWVKRIQISARLAELFDQYVVFRPDMIESWERSNEGDDPDERWQASLWRMVKARDTHDRHRGQLRRELLEAFAAPPADSFPLPRRIFMFGVSSLPPFHLDTLSGLAMHTDVHVFTMNPSAELWEDLVSPRQLARKTVAAGGKDLSHEHFDVGNPLLASLGAHGAEFFRMLHDRDFFEQQLPFIEPGDDSMLSALQTDMLFLRDENAERIPVAEQDDSIQIHSCHSPMREIETLHNVLLDRFEREPRLKPRDIVVMTPDIELYAPYIQAVFDSPSPATNRIPYAIADRKLRGSGLIADFLTLLDLPQHRFGAAETAALIEAPCVRRGLGIGEEQALALQRWIEKSGIRWGLDANSKIQHELPPTEEHTWQAGLNRLFLGYAMSGDRTTLFQGILPIEGCDPAVLSILSRFIDAAADMSRRLEVDRTVSDWSAVLLSVFDTFMASDDESREDAEALREVLYGMGEDARLASFSEAVPFECIRRYLEQVVGHQESRSGFLTGGVTFCSLRPMRSIPAKAICLLGMNDLTYPRTEARPGFDLLARDSRPGDRNRRKDDRYIFLEAILSARSLFYVSYLGQSIADNSTLPPSVVVSELLDYATSRFRRSSPDDTAAVPGVTRHRLHAFSPCYFRRDTEGSPRELYSYSRADFEAARALRSPSAQQKPFLSTALPLPEDASWRNLSVDTLLSFFHHPTRFFLVQRMDIALPIHRSGLNSDEPLVLDALDRYHLEQELLAHFLEGASSEELFPVMREKGILPQGAAGRSTFDMIAAQVERVADKVRENTDIHSPPGFLDCNLALEEFRIAGRLHPFVRSGLLHCRFASIKARDRIRAWVSHLLLNACADRESAARTSYLIGRSDSRSSDKPVTERQIRYAPLQDAPQRLLELLALLEEGMRQALPLFPEASLAYASAIRAGKKHEVAIDRAQRVWAGSDYSFGSEGSDPYNQLYWEHAEPLGSRFTDVAARVFIPMLDHEATGGATS